MVFNYLEIFKLVDRFISDTENIGAKNIGLQKPVSLSFEDFAQSSQDPQLAKYVFTILSKAPKSFLAEIDRGVCANIVLHACEHLNTFLNQTTSNLIESYTEQGHSYIIVALNDQPFIINTFNNLFETLQITTPLVLHPILEVNKRKTSLSIIYFESASQSEIDRLIAELSTVLPILQKVINDFSVMDQASIELWQKLKASNQTETADFVAWLAKGRIAFIGFAKAKLDLKNKTFNKQNFIQLAGLLDCDLEVSTKIQADLLQDYSLFEDQQNFLITKVSSLSPVHYRRRLLHFAFLLPETNEVYSFLGLWTSRAIQEEVSNAPIVRKKVESYFDQSDLAAKGHDFKAITRAINLTPKQHLLSASVQQIRAEMQLLQEVEFSGKSHADLRLDRPQRGAIATFVIRTENFSSELKDILLTKLENYFKCEINQTDFYLTSLNEKTCRLYFYSPLGKDFDRQQAQADKLEILIKQLLDIVLGWKGHLELLLEKSYGSAAHKVYKYYKSAFTSRYQALTSPAEAILDIELCQALSETSPVKVRIDQSSDQNAKGFGIEEPTFTIAKLGEAFKLSQVLPILENLSFVVLDSETIELSLPSTDKTIYLHRFSLENNLPDEFNLLHFQQVSAPAIEQVLKGIEESDSLNSLLILANLDFRAVKALRLLSNLMWQIRKSSSRLSLRACLTNNPECSRLLWTMFQTRFDPNLELSIEQRNMALEKLNLDLQSALKLVQDILEDANIKAYALLIINSLRTNFFSAKETLAIKLHSKELPILRGTKPLYETFVYSQQIEGVHLRSAKIARGGIRWSDRREDYRTEVLGLMRVQRIKNAIVVPSGAKGGFIVKDGSKLSTNRDIVISGYKDYIRALLSLSDNIVAGKIEAPQNLVVYDSEDPYLVVAADKGTAAFSDYANQVACQEFNFWLGDGFASGGSKGYSHKELGITAKGAWECSKRHFIDLGIDFNSTAFSVVGIGDMSGDVFGNGLLQTPNMKLVAAFDHRHIFIDPDPNLELAFNERKRLFSLARSSWNDYNKEIISTGGAVYDRSEKEINLSEQARKLFGVSESIANPFSSDQIISLILKAQVDLLWNGGIGTYVKASSEVDSEINDSANDAVRVNAAELRCKIVAEGGNLGFTQAARIEFALKGGRINTDAIDNSAGVDLSDHEVNLKILFEQLKQQNICDQEQRDQILTKLSDQVAQACLVHNRNQSFVISVAENASKKNLDYFKALIRELSSKGYINRTIDGLPSDDEIEKRALKRVGLTRPEICLFLAGMKLWIKDEIVSSGLASQDSVVNFGLKYFPSEIQSKYLKQIKEHKLFQNIVTSELSNHLVDVYGITFLHRLQLSEGVDFAEALKASVAASLVFDAQQIMSELDQLDNFNFRQEYKEGRLDLGRALRVVATQFVHRFSGKLNILQCIQLYKQPINNLMQEGNKCFGEGVIRDNFNYALTKRLQKGLADPLSNSLSFCHLSWLGLDAADLANSKKISVIQAHSLLINVWEELKLHFLLLGNVSLNAQNIWEHELLLSTYDRLRVAVANITASLFDFADKNELTSNPTKAKKLLSASPKLANLELIVAEFKNTPNLAILHALARYLDNFTIN